VRQDITWVALDTSKSEHAVAVLGPDVKAPRMSSVKNASKELTCFARRLLREAPGEVRICYEAGACGFALQRLLEGAGLRCEVIAPSLIPVRPGQRVKTDRRDAAKLVRLFRSGELTVVHPPSEAEEALRDLLRCREDARGDLMRARHLLSKFLLRHGLVYRSGRAWTQRHGQWLSGLRWAHQADELVFEDYRLAIGYLEDRLRALDLRIEAFSQEVPYREPVGWLRCLRGVDTVTAMTILAEIHDFTRFSSPAALMSYLGLVPSEYSSGDRRRQGGLTKAGNGHVRRILIEAAWHARHRPAVGYSLRKRREGQPAWVIAHADRAMRRLHRRYGYLFARGKPHNKVVAAVARELVGFLWALLQRGKADEQRSESALRHVISHAA
jgi:transposase